MYHKFILYILLINEELAIGEEYVKKETWEYKKLTELERSSLKLAYRQNRDGRVRDRIKAVLLYDDGYSMEEIARVLLLSDEAIRKHLRDYHGREKLKPSNGGSYSKLSAEQEKELMGMS